MVTIDQLARTPLSQIIVFAGACTAVRLGLLPLVKPVTGHWAPKILNELLDAVVYAGVFVFLLIRPFAVQTFTIPSESMLDTIQVSDYVAANKAVYRYTDPVPGDIVVFRPPVEAAHPDQIDAKGEVKVDFIKRLIGGPGDLIEIKEGEMYRNGTKVDEPFLKSRSDFDFKLVERDGKVMPVAILGEFVNSPYTGTVDKYQVDDAALAEQLRNAPAVKVPAGHYLFMGDNRRNSSDGRAWGVAPRDAVVGRADFIWWPPSRWRKLR